MFKLAYYQKKKWKKWSNPRNKQKKSHSILNSFCQQVANYLKTGTILKKKGWFFFPFLFPRSCSCLRLFTWGMFGSEWQENVTGTNKELCGIPRVFYISRHTLWQPDAEFTLHLTGPYLHGETAWIRNNSIAPFPPLCFHSPHQNVERWNEREWRKKGKLCERNYSQAKKCLI